MKILCFVLLLFLTVPVFAVEQTDLTIDWIFSPQRSRFDGTPQSKWLPNGNLIFCDPHIPDATRTLEIFDPASGKRTPALDMPKAIASLKSFLGEKNTPAVLDWPTPVETDGAYSGFNSSGTQAYYIFAGDIFVLDLASAKFERITKTDAVEEAVSFSPDGKTIAFARNNDLYLYDLQSGTERRLTTTGSETMHNGTLSWVYWEEIFGHSDVGYWWSPDSKTIAFLQTDESPVSTMYFPDFEPYQPRIIRQRYPKAGEANPIVKVGILNVADSTIAWSNIPSQAYEYIVRVNWLSNSTKFIVQTLNRSQTEATLYLVDRQNGAASAILKEGDPSWRHIYDIYLFKDGNHFLWISERTGFAHLYYYDISGKLLKQVTAGNWSLKPFGAYLGYNESPLVAVDEKHKWIYFTAAEKSTIEQHLYRIHLNGSGMQRLSKEDGFHAAAFRDDAEYYTDTYSNVSTIPSLTLHRADGTNTATLVSANMEQLAPFHMIYPEFIKVPASDGFSLPAQINKPAAVEAKNKFPVIVYVYGGPASPSVQNQWNANNWAEDIFYEQLLLRQGYIVFSVDSRSSAAISHALESSVEKQMLGDVELKDLVDAVEWLKKQPYVDPDRIGIWGWSGGGTYTLLGMTRSKEFKAGISVAPVTDWHYYDTRFTELFMKEPKDNEAGYEKTSLVKTARNLHGHLLMVHGTHDDNVHPQNSQAFMNQLIAADILFEVMIYPMRHHNISDAPAEIHLYKTMLEFWKRNL